MRTREAVSPEKLRGGFYSPEILVKLCLDRVQTLLASRDGLRVLEPTAGDGAFLRGLQAHALGSRVGHVEAIELLDSEATKIDRFLDRSELPGRVLNANVLEWYTAGNTRDYDVVLANPPYVRFQFINDEDKQRAKDLSSELGVVGSSVSNLWIPVFLLALNSLADGGVFSVILPTEFLTGVSASRVRGWLLDNTTDLSIDLFKPGSFPAVLQEVLVLSGRRTSANQTSTVEFADHNGGSHTWTHVVDRDAKTWTAYLLSPAEVEAYRFAQALKSVDTLGRVARFSVSTVTGANAYFCLSTSEVRAHELEPWALPLLGRSRQARGLFFTGEDHGLLADEDQPSWILSFAANRPDPTKVRKALEYIHRGELLDIHTRYKTRIRTPWYRVPIVSAGDLLLSKRSNEFPRVIANHAKAITTDTIYKGQVLASSGVTANDVTASFHNSLTLLSAEIEGRSFGGGVLELVPSEVSALLIPTSPEMHEHLPRLDATYRESRDGAALIEATDGAIEDLVPELTQDVMDSLRGARDSLLTRRIVRSTSEFYED
ncbi:Eco57I restriction-modification methylase domain-containing protein [Curtobacterium sp. KBS0715]|uniref:Eco57I restriction-modification methylase domain-containing protein n=1 Tax=Curtobacterium sp. KBS0715 TaxID=1179671 RepID=UPI00110DE129|nr:N-6 DNA methylase [Curtobacterium sp. KBS0715]TSD11644.1 N-6 DNA methylase [Curtobacterium sp. KBS0715]